MAHVSQRSQATYQKFVKRWEEVMDLPPQTVGPLTPMYKWLTKRLKVMPWPAFIFTATATAGLVYFLLGSTITFIVSLLQKGF